MKKYELPKNVFVQDGRLYFRKLYNKTWYRAAFCLTDSNVNRRSAKYLVTEINAKMKCGTFDPNNFPLLAKYHNTLPFRKFPVFADYADIWLDKKKHLAPATFKTYKTLTIKHLVPYFGAMPVNEITKLVVERWQSISAQKLSKAYSNDCLRRLKAILYEAEDDYGFDLRLKRIKPLQDYGVQDTIEDQIYSMEEASRLYYVMGRRLQTMMLCSMLAGLRTGEVIALKREDVNFDRNIVHVKANMSAGERKRPKSRATAEVYADC
jgi:integrase